MKTFASEMARAKTMQQLSSNPDEADYYAGYIRGLRRKHHGNSFGTQSEHDSQMQADSEEGRGYREAITK